MSLTEILLREMSVERGDAIVFELGSHGGIEVPKSLDVVAHLVLDGEIVIDVDEMEAPVVMKRGEYGLLMYGNRHRIHMAKGNSSNENHLVEAWPIGDEPTVRRIGEGFPAATFISAALRTSGNPVSVQTQHPLPELMHLRRGLQPVVTGAALLTDMDELGRACRGPGGNAFVTALMNMHLFQAIRLGNEQIKSAVPLVSPMKIFRSPSVRPVAVAVRMLRLHPEKHWTLAELARELGMSRSSLATHFSAYVGMGPMEYLTNVRMEKAAHLVQNRHDLSLCAVSRQVGYSHTSSFVRAFKAHFGAPPKAFGNQGGIDVAHAAAVPAVIGLELAVPSL